MTRCEQGTLALTFSPHSQYYLQCLFYKPEHIQISLDFFVTILATDQAQVFCIEVQSSSRSHTNLAFQLHFHCPVPG